MCVYIHYNVDYEINKFFVPMNISVMPPNLPYFIWARTSNVASNVFDEKIE